MNYQYIGLHYYKFKSGNPLNTGVWLIRYTNTPLPSTNHVLVPKLHTFTAECYPESKMLV